MDEYIKREPLLKDLELLAAYQQGERQQGILGVCETIRRRKAEDVVEVRHGEWIEYHGQSYLVHPMKYDEYGPILQDYVSYKCSECGRTENKKEPYCHCGAKMDGKGDT